MSKEQNSPTHWSFQSPDSDSGEDSAAAESENPSFVSRIQETLQGNLSFFIGAFLLGTIVLGLLILNSRQPTNVNANVPGGKIESLTKQQVNSWVAILQELSDNREQYSTLSLHSETPIRFFSELKQKEHWKKQIRPLCEEEDLSFDQFLHVTMEIGLARAVLDKPTVFSNTDSPSDDQEQKKDRKNLSNNQQLVKEHRKKIEETWNQFINRYLPEKTNAS